MYTQFFGLKQAPFSIAPDPHYLFMSDRHREALAHLLFAVEGGGGFVLVSGEIGAGKTTVCRCFLEQVPAHCNVAYIFNPKLAVLELLQTMLQELHIEPPSPSLPGSANVSVKDYVDALNRYLLAQHAAGRSTALVIDEAQNLSADVLEQLRLLTNLETHERKLLQIILIGQPELRTLLAGPQLEQLAQRIIARFHLGALGADETQAYVRHRLAVAGLQGPLPFDDAALARVHALSRGVPRRINLLCDRALLGAYAQGQARVGRAVLERAALEVFDTPARSRAAQSGDLWAAFTPGRVATGLVALALAGGVWWQAQRGFGAADTSLAASAKDMVPAQALSAGLAAQANAGAPAQGPAHSAQTTSPAAPAGAPTDLAALVAQLPSSPAQAWAAHAGVWGFQSAADNPCTGAPGRDWRCMRIEQTHLAQLQQIDRPGLLTLYDAAGTARYALMSQLDGQSLRLQVGQQSLQLPHGALASLWRGQFAAPWAVPAPLQALPRADASLPSGTDPAALALLAVLGDSPEGDMVLRLSAFQLRQGLTPDGLLGNQTLMQVARQAMPAQPRLQPATPAASVPSPQ